MLQGSCLCRAVRYEITGFELDIAYCHCSMCRKSTGAASGVYGLVSQGNLTWLSGADSIQTYRSSARAERGFCRQCGSSLFYRLVGDAAGYEMALGTLDDEPDHYPNAHIYCDSRPAWAQPGDPLPEFSRGRSD